MICLHKWVSSYTEPNAPGRSQRACLRCHKVQLPAMAPRWIGTALCLAGMACTAAQLHPVNLVLSGLGSAVWADHGRRTRDGALWVVEVAAVLICLAGLVHWLTFSWW